MSYAGRHDLQTDNHRIEAFVFADAAARTAGTGYTLTAEDVSKIAFQTDTGDYWRLTDESPITWLQLTGSGSVPDATTTVKGKVELATDGEVTANVVVQGNDSRLTAGADLATHLADSSAAHAASAISVVDTAGFYTGTNVEAVLAEIAASLRAITWRVVSGTTDTPVLTDAGKGVSLESGSATTLTLPQNSDVAFPVGTVLSFRQLGAGLVTTVAGTGATVVALVGLVSAGQYARWSAEKISTNGWLLSGELAA